MSLSARFASFLAEDKKHGLIWAPTQVGKSAALVKFIETCMSLKTPVIVSTDNKTDQCEQLYDRVAKGLRGQAVDLVKVGQSNFQKRLRDIVKSGSQRYVVFCLNNSVQINALIEGLVIVGCGPDKSAFNTTARLALSHDEADTITKDPNTEDVCEWQAESHKAWLQLIAFFRTTFPSMDLKRMFVTATPENCCLLYNIVCPDVFRIDVPCNYVGYTDVAFAPLSDSKKIKDILQEEVSRIKATGTNEIILYCVDRKVGNGQDVALGTFASLLECTVNTYNGKGIAVMFPNLGKRFAFEEMLRAHKIPFTHSENITKIKTLTIRRFYTMCKAVGEKCVVTIGKDLIARGISYVGEDEFEPLTATTMIYKPGTTMHAVGITQTVGRITGCAMPNLQRKLYAPKDVIDTYVAYNKNQQIYIDNLQGNTDEAVKDVIDALIFKRYKRSIDRKNLNLNMNMEVPVSSKNDRQPKGLSNLKRWWKANTITGKVLRFVFNEALEGVPKYEVLTFLYDNGSENVNQFYKHITQREYSDVYEEVSESIRLKPAARHFIDTELLQKLP
jgi:hypothetical protein